VQVAAGQRVGQLRKDVVEHALAQVLRHFFFVQPGFVQGMGVEAAARVVPGLGQEGVAAEEDEEQAQRCVGGKVVGLAGDAGQGQRGGQVQFKKLLGAGAGVLPVKPPDGTVGEQAPLDGAVGHHVGPAEVAQHLRGRGVGVVGVGGVATVQRAQPALGLQNGQAVAVALVVFQGQRGGLGLCRGKQQHVGHVFTAFAREVDLRQGVVAPTQGQQHFLDDHGFGLRLVQGGVGVQAAEDGLQRAFEGGQRGVVQRLMGRRFKHAARQEVVGKKLALHGCEVGPWVWPGKCKRGRWRAVLYYIIYSKL